MTIKAIKPGSKRTATSTGKPDQRQHDNKKTQAILHRQNYRNQKQKNRVIILGKVILLSRYIQDVINLNRQD